jgi:CRISPR-associated protein Cas2
VRPRNEDRGSDSQLPDPPRRREQPYLFAYDISCPRRARRVLRCLRRWRIGGQLSVHETLLTPALAESLATEVLDYVDRQADSLLLGRLGLRGGASRFALSQTEPVPPLLGHEDAEWPARFHPGAYLLTYDIRDDRRLRRVQKASATVCAFLQRSVYLYQGGGGLLAKLLSEVGELVERKVDDVRVYPLNAAEDLWFLCGPPPPLAGFDGTARLHGHDAAQAFDWPWEA